MIMQKFFCAGIAVACRLMMFECYAVIITHIIQLMTYTLKNRRGTKFTYVIEIKGGGE